MTITALDDSITKNMDHTVLKKHTSLSKATRTKASTAVMYKIKGQGSGLSFSASHSVYLKHPMILPFSPKQIFLQSMTSYNTGKLLLELSHLFLIRKRIYLMRHCFVLDRQLFFYGELRESKMLSDEAAVCTC